MIMNPPAWIGLALIVLVSICAAAASLLAPIDPTRSSVFFLQGPSQEHLLGTDELGRDILSRVIHGARTSLLVGAGAALVALLIGAPVGLAAGYFRGKVDLVMVPIIDLFIALPGLVL